jgi:hypothetical protein
LRKTINWSKRVALWLIINCALSNLFRIVWKSTEVQEIFFFLKNRLLGRKANAGWKECHACEEEVETWPHYSLNE